MSIQAPVYPVILCGGSGERLWPASRPSLPKPFLALVGDLSTFQQAVRRAQPLVREGGIVIVGGVAHRAVIEGQLASLGVEATILLEPEPRNSGPAIAAAAAWIVARDPEAIAVVLPADQHIADQEAFAEAVGATFDTARAGAVVTLGVRPRGASTAYGYILPDGSGAGTRPVTAFVEKPDLDGAQRCVAAGFLWNSGIFIATAGRFLEETAAFAPAIAEAARKAVQDATEAGATLTLGADFRHATNISFDRAVMEKTRRAAVLPVAFAWSDLGAWDAVWAVSPKDEAGVSLSRGATAIDASDVFVRAPDGVQVMVRGVSRLAVVVERDAVLVCALDTSQDVRPPATAPSGRFGSLDEAAAWFTLWLATAALPLWATLGVDAADGGFLEGLTPQGAPFDPRRRARVQARQAFVFATAAVEGIEGPWRPLAGRGYDAFIARGRRADGLFVDVLTPDGEVADATPRLYEHAFHLLALSALHRADPVGGAAIALATELRDGLMAFRHEAGGFREAGDRPFQANAQMHLLEATLAWEAAAGDAGWARLADELVALALSRFIDPDTGALQEFFDASWGRLTGEAGAVEPGHQFEWAWLLERWGAARGDLRARQAARRLFEVGRRGVDPRRGVVVNALWDDLSIRDPAARLWPQTEFLKASLVLGEREAALAAAASVARFLTNPVHGAWRERMRGDGSFIEEPAPATSLYHLTSAILELRRFKA